MFLEPLEPRLLFSAHHPRLNSHRKPLPVYSSHRPSHDPGVTLPGPEPVPPPAPAVALVATATAVESNEIDLSWNADATGATYTVVRGVLSAPPGDYVPLVQVVVARTTGAGWHDTGLAQAVTYDYTVTKSDGEIAPPVQATTWLAAPSDLTASYAANGAGIVLNWQDHSQGLETGIEVDREFNDGPWAVDVILPPGATTWSEDSAVTYGIYSYRVRAL